VGAQSEAFDDIPCGGFGTPEKGFVLRWKNSAISRKRLGQAETARQLDLGLQRCNPTNRASVSADVDRTKSGIDPTVFDWLIEIIQVPCPGGGESQDGVELELK